MSDFLKSKIIRLLIKAMVAWTIVSVVLIVLQLLFGGRDAEFKRQP